MARIPDGRTLATVLVLMLALDGCAGFHLHDAEREKMAQAAKKSFETADVKATLAAARENHAALTEAEVAQARRTVEARRDLLLNAIAGDEGCAPALERAGRADTLLGAEPRKPVSGGFHGMFAACIQRELDGLLAIPAGSNASAVLTRLRRAVATLEVFGEGMATDRARVRVLFKGLELPDCEPRTAPPAMPPAALIEEANKKAPDEPLEPHYTAFVGKCTKYQEALGDIGASATGKQLGTAVQEWMDGLVALETARNTAAQLTQRYREAANAYDAAAKELEKGETKVTREAFDKAVKGLQEASKALEGGGGFFGVKALSEERLADLDAIIGALGGAELDAEKYDAGLRRSVGVLLTLPTFSDRALDIARRRQAPPIGPLILEKGLHQARAEAAGRAVERAQRRVTWLERRMTAQRDRAIRLLDAADRLERAAAQGPLPDTAVKAFSNATPARARVLLRQAITEYSNSFSIDGVAAAEAEYRLVALEYETALDRSEDAVKEWQALIAVPIDRLIAYHASGIRPAEVAALLAHLLIGVGVNR
ncbi:MAG TPA: hypothetical protein VFW70_01205 [Methylomirabilota bacterium]|nr:hypothetical protein [Methylomirabilota bacterium]